MRDGGVQFSDHLPVRERRVHSHVHRSYKCILRLSLAFTFSLSLAFAAFPRCWLRGVSRCLSSADGAVATLPFAAVHRPSTASHPAVPLLRPQYSGPLNRLVVLRDNHVRSNGGIFVGGNTADVLVEGCTVANSTCPNATEGTHAGGSEPVAQAHRCIAVDRSRATGVVTRNNRYVGG